MATYYSVTRLHPRTNAYEHFYGTYPTEEEATAAALLHARNTGKRHLIRWHGHSFNDPTREVWEPCRTVGPEDAPPAVEVTRNGPAYLLPGLEPVAVQRGDAEQARMF